MTLILLVPVLFLVGCGQDQQEPQERQDRVGQQDDGPVVLTVGETEIPLSALERAFEEILAQDEGYTPDSTSARRFLNQYVRKTLMEQIAADSVNFNPLLEHRATSYMENLMVHQMRYEAYGHAADIPEEEIRRVWEMARTQYRYRAIGFEAEEDAIEQLARLRDGLSFDEMAKELVGPDAGGDSGWQTTLSAPESVIATLDDMSPEEIGGPVEAKGIWYVFQFLEKAPNPSLYTFEESMQGLRIRMVQDRGTRLVREFNQGIFDKYEYEARMDEVEWITEFFRVETKDVPRSSDLNLKPGERPEAVMPDWQSCPLNEEEQKVILSTTTVDTVRALLFLDHVLSQPSFSWPRFDDPQQTISMLKTLVLERLSRVEAWEREYDLHPDIAWKASKRRNLILVRYLMRQKIRPRTRPTMAEVEVFYAEKLRAEGIAEERRYSLITTRSEEAAAQARELFAAGTPIQELLVAVKKTDPTTLLVGGAAGRTTTSRPNMSALETEVFRLGVGGVTAVHPVATTFGVARLEEVSGGGGVQPLHAVLEDVTKEYMDIKADELLNIYLEERRQITSIKIDEAVFKEMDFTLGGQTETGGAAR